MAKKKPVREFTSRYCPKLEDEVVVLHGKDANGFPTETCLSSHLCGGEARASCESGGISKTESAGATF